MTKAEWGTKRTCTTCGARFYDMLKDPIICPKCGAENEKDVAPKKRGKASTPKPEPVRKPARSVADSDDDDTDDDDDDDETTRDLIEDASDLGEDDDDMAEVIEHIEPGDKED